MAAARARAAGLLVAVDDRSLGTGLAGLGVEVGPAHWKKLRYDDMGGLEVAP